MTVRPEKNHYSVLIIGAGPGGLTCARILAKAGIDCLVVEKKDVIGRKVCAGGITWSGLIQNVPEQLIERSFETQYIRTRLQNFRVHSETPIIATINRVKVGQYMAGEAEAAGAEIFSATRATIVADNSVRIKNLKTGKEKEITCDSLIGADGSTSIVRRHLGLASTRKGLGIHYQIPGRINNMEWHLNSRLFKNGYGWVFPHTDSISIGAYVDQQLMSARQLKENLLLWAGSQGYELQHFQPHAEYINFDYRGHHFNSVYLLGEAAGLASPLTGEGIYPAILSAETVAGTIIDPGYDQTHLQRLIDKQQFFLKMITKTGRNRWLNMLIIELSALSLRLGFTRFQDIEMA